MIFKINLIRVAIPNNNFKIVLKKFRALIIIFSMRKQMKRCKERNLKQKTRDSKTKIED